MRPLPLALLAAVLARDSSAREEHIAAPIDLALVEVTFDPKDTTTLDVQYTDCVVVPLAAK